jgi:type IV pilus assembly protein PilW
VTVKARGFTLLEVVITLAILLIVIGALFGVVTGQQAAFFEGNMQRAAQGSVRAALSFVSQKVADAGFGMDPVLAFDFTSTVAPCPTLANPCARDRVDGNDELVFFARNSRYWVPDDYATDPAGNAWRIGSVSSSEVVVRARANDAFPKGRILQAVCRGATRFAYFTVSQTVSTTAVNNSFSIPLEAVSTTNPFLRQDQAADTCFSTGEARLFLIDRFRFHVRPVAVSGQVIPYLMLDAGLDANNNGWDEGEEVVVAEGIESFQVAYDLTSSALAPRGSVAGTAIAFTAGFPGVTTGSGMTTLQFPGTVLPGQTDYQPTSWFDYSVGPPAHATRLTDHQANIRAVRVSLVGRAPNPNASGPGTGTLLPVLNQNALPTWLDVRASYNRTRVDATVPVRNMTSRGLLDQ